MTTNLSEALNWILKGAKLLPMTAFTKLTFNCLVKCFNLCRDEADCYLRKHQPWPTNVYQLCKKTVIEAYSHRATACIGLWGQLGYYEVTTTCSGQTCREIEGIFLYLCLVVPFIFTRCHALM